MKPEEYKPFEEKGKGVKSLIPTGDKEMLERRNKLQKMERKLKDENPKVTNQTFRELLKAAEKDMPSLITERLKGVVPDERHLELYYQLKKMTNLLSQAKKP